jgi:hypothetical protein
MQSLYRVSPSAECLYRDKTSMNAVVDDGLVVARHELLRCGHSSTHSEARARDVRVRSRHVVSTAEVLIAGPW